MVFNGLPAIFDDKVHNEELYIQKKIYGALELLNILPINQNPTGLFTNYINGDVELGDPIYSNNNITFNQIKFGQGTTVGGQTLPIGFVYGANTRDEQRGKYNSSLMNFFNKATIKMADFFEDKFNAELKNGARVGSNNFDITDAESIINSELTVDDEMRYDADDNATGYAPNIAFVNRANKLEIEKALAKEDYTSNLRYIASNKIDVDEILFMDTANPSVTVEKYADPVYSVIQSLENDNITVPNGDILPPAFINLDIRSERPQTRDYYLWAESNLNILDSNGILTSKIKGD